MNRWMHTPARAVLGLAVAALSSACLLTLSADPTSSPGAMSPADTGPGSSEGTDAPLPPAGSTVEPTLTLTLAPSLTLTPTWTSTATEAPLTMTAGQKLSCVKGPHWVLYDWVTSIEDGETVTLLARGMTDEEYYYIRKSDGKECWAFGGSSTKSGPTAGLPERESPPYPVITYTVENRFYTPMFDLFIRGANETAWGADRLGASNIPIGGTFSLTLTAGFYDVMLKDFFGIIFYSKTDTPIGPEESSRYIILDAKFTRNIRNSTTSNLCTVELSPSGSSTWSAVPIGGDGIFSVGETIPVTGIGGAYGIRMFRCGDNALIILSDLRIAPGLSTMVY